MKSVKSPILEIELHKIFESYPDILADVFVEAGILAPVKAKHFEVFYRMEYWKNLNLEVNKTKAVFIRKVNECMHAPETHLKPPHLVIFYKKSLQNTIAKCRKLLCMHAVSFV